MEGQFDIEIGGTLHHVKPGDVAFVPRGTIHAFKNVGQTQSRLRYAFTPAADIEAMFRAFYNAAGDAPPSQEMFERIALAHGQKLVGSPL